MSSAAPDRDPSQLLQHEVLEPLKQVFVGKDDIVDLLGVSLVAGENLFLLGPPGTAKSALVHELGRRLHGETFEYLLTRFTEPNELFGPFDIRRLREGDLVTNTEGMLPEAHLVFLDELLNANSAILNSLLTVLNERTLRRGREIVDLPLLMVVGASNQLPEDEALRALFDRFLLRVSCDNVEPDQLAAVLEAGWQLDVGDSQVEARVGVNEVRALSQLLPDVDLTTLRPVYLELVQRLRQAGLRISDRRAVKMQRLVGASALLCQRRVADPSDLWVFRHIWDSEEEQEVLVALVDEVLQKHAGACKQVHPRAQVATAPDPERLAAEVDEIARRVQQGIDEEQKSELSDRLALLAGRCQWVKSDVQRGELHGRIDELWRAFEGA